MTVELGHVALIVALCMAVCQTLVPMAGSFKGYQQLDASGADHGIRTICVYGVVFCLFGHGLS